MYKQIIFAIQSPFLFNPPQRCYVYNGQNVVLGFKRRVIIKRVVWHKYGGKTAILRILQESTGWKFFLTD